MVSSSEPVEAARQDHADQGAVSYAWKKLRKTSAYQAMSIKERKEAGGAERKRVIANRRD